MPSPKPAIVIGAIACAIVQITAIIRTLPGTLAGARGVDFLYMFEGARLIWAGRGADVFRLTISNHLPFETLLLSPLSGLGFRAAYLFVVAVDFGLLLLALRRLKLRWPWMLVACAFTSTTFAIFHGEDSIFSLLAVASAAIALSEDRDFAAGAWVGLTMYKPQIALPICGLMFLWSRWRFVKGFSATAASCVALSIAAVGPRAFIQYMGLLHGMAESSSTEARYHIRVVGMVGLHGLLANIFQGNALVVLSLAASAAVFAYAFTEGRAARASDQIVIAVAACCLANYHMFPPDFVIVLLPFAVAWRLHGDPALSWSWFAVFVATLIFGRTQSFVALPMLVFFVLLARALGSGAASRAAQLREENGEGALVAAN